MLQALLLWQPREGVVVVLVCLHRHHGVVGETVVHWVVHSRWTGGTSTFLGAHLWLREEAYR